jgi:hypothetical protein
MVREDFVLKQYSKLRVSVLKKKGRGNPIENELMTKEEPVNIAPGQEISFLAPNQSSFLSTEVMPEKIVFSTEERPRRSLDGSSGNDTFLFLDPSSNAINSPRNALSGVNPEDIGLTVDQSVGLSIGLNELLQDHSSDESNEEIADGGCNERDNSDAGSDTVTDMNWIDVGAEIGIKLLGSAAVQKAMASQDTVETISTLKERVESHIKLNTSLGNVGARRKYRRVSSLDDRLLMGSNECNDEDRSFKSDRHSSIVSHPVNPMWTSASSAASPVHSPEAICSKNVPLDHSNDSPATILIPKLPQPHPIDVVKSSPSVLPNQQKERLTTKSAASITSNTQQDTIPSNMVKSATSSKKPTSEKRNHEENVNYVQTQPENTFCRQNPSAAGSSTSPPIVPKRQIILPGTKIVVPLFPYQPGIPKPPQHLLKSRYQMATVVSSRRICVFQKNKLPSPGSRGTNCLSITVKLDKSFLRNGEFATMTMRIMDEWGPRYMPRHSKLPIGTCVATTFGLGVLVGWRVEDDCHIVRSLWQRRGPGSALAYLRRDSIHATMEASNGFEVETKVGRGTVCGYIHGGKDFRRGRYLVLISEKGRNRGQILELNRSDVLSCKSAQFVPVVEHIRAAARYQLQIDFYKEAVTNEPNDFAEIFGENKVWSKVSKNLGTLWNSFLRAIDEDEEFDDGLNEFVQSCVNFLERLDAPEGPYLDSKGRDFESSFVITTTESSHSSQKTASSKLNDLDRSDSGFWLMNNMFGLFGGQHEKGDEENSGENQDTDIAIEVQCGPPRVATIDKQYERAFAVLRTLMRTVTITQAACADEPDFKLGLSICYEFLLFVKTVIKVQRKNVNPESLIVWRRAWEEIISVFWPVVERMERIAQGIAERMEKQGRRAKVRVLRFVDIIVSDDTLVSHLEQGDWETCAKHFEEALVSAKIIDQDSREHYHKTAQFLYNHFSSAIHRNDDATDRNNKKLANFLVAVQLMASPRKAILKLFLQDWVLDALERIFVRVFSKEEVATRMLTIHSSSFQTLRQFRLLKNFTIAGKLWIPLLDAADEEISSMVSTLPDNAKEYLSPLASLFSLCVAQFHKISQGDLTKDWLDFLMEDAAADIIHEVDMKLILALQSFSRDVKQMMVVLPYYPSIDIDILNLVDELDIDELVKEASIALEDEDRLHGFLRDKAMMALERFLVGNAIFAELAHSVGIFQSLLLPFLS